jgi:O-antigen/teichoic acid export membrane protein
MRDSSIAALPRSSKLQETQPRARTSSDGLSEGRQRLPINVLSNVTWLVLNMVVGIWYTPFLIDHLGVAVYGLVPLASSVTNYLTILTQGLNCAVSRFLTVDLVKGDVDAANRTFNTALASGLAIGGILLPVALILSWFAPQMFDIPLGYERDTQWLLFLIMVAFMITMFASSFAVSSYAYHRFDLRLLVNVVRLVAQVGTIVVLFTVLSPQLWQVGSVILLSAILSLLGQGALWRKLTPELKMSLKLFDLSHLKQMLEFSGWVLVNQVGSLLFLNIDVIVTNLIFGAEVAGRYGAVLVFPSLLRALVATVADVLRPVFVTLYAQDDPSKLVHFSRLSVKFTGLAMALPIGLLCGLGRPLLTEWLGPEFSDLAWLLVALVGHLCINIAVIPLFSLQVATNTVRIPGIVTLIMGIANVALAVALALWSGWGYISIALAGAIVLTAKNAIFTPVYGARTLDLPWWSFFPSIVAGIVGCVTVSVGAYWISLTWTLAGWDQLALVTVVMASIYLCGAYLWGLNSDDRRLLKSEIQRRIKR